MDRLLKFDPRNEAIDPANHCFESLQTVELDPGPLVQPRPINELDLASMAGRIEDPDTIGLVARPPETDLSVKCEPGAPAWPRRRCKRLAGIGDVHMLLDCSKLRGAAVSGANCRTRLDDRRQKPSSPFRIMAGETSIRNGPIRNSAWIALPGPVSAVQTREP